MDAFHVGRGLHDSHPSRSRDYHAPSTLAIHQPLGERHPALSTNSTAATTPASHANSPTRGLSSLPSKPSTSTDTAASPAYLTYPPPTTAAFFPAPLRSSQPHSVSGHNWKYPKHLTTTLASPHHHSSRAQLHTSAIQQSRPTASSTTTTSHVSSPASMSTLGIQYDSRFDAGTRASYSWPMFDIQESYGSQNLGSMDPFHEPQSTEAVFARALSSSPSQGMFTTEQRELKRQKDLARRTNKTRFRRQRSSSSSYTSHSTTPDIVPRGVGLYPASITSAPLQNETLLPLSSNPYLTTSAPSVPSSESPEIYGPQFSLPPSEFNNGGYIIPFSSAPSEHNLTSYAPRPHSLPCVSDQPYFYRSPPLLTPEAPDTVRVVHSRPKPQCWEHGCNGRQFSTFSNLLRHQREKSGVASKPTCPKCGAEFTRTTARNGHMAHEKCKQRRNS